MKKRRFTIGDIVEVDKEHRVVSRYVKDKKVMQRYNHGSVHGNAYKEVVIGVITGLKRFIEGEYYPASKGGSFYWYEDAEYEPGGVIWEKTITCWGVRTGYLNKELYFFEKDIEEVDPIHHHDIPLLETGWNKKYREQMSRESKEWPRNEKGRFC